MLVLPTPDTPVAWSELKGHDADRVRAIVRKPTLRRRSPAETFTCQPVLLQWLIDHPDWVTAFWRALKVDVLPVERSADGFICRDGAQLTIQFHVIHETPQVRVVHAVGEARGPLTPIKLRAEMVMVHRYNFHRVGGVRYLAVHDVESFTLAEGPALKAVASLAKGACEQAVDQAVRDMMLYFSLLCRLLQYRPDWALRSLDQLALQRPADEAAELAELLKGLPKPDRAITSIIAPTMQRIELPPFSNLAAPANVAPAALLSPPPRLESNDRAPSTAPPLPQGGGPQRRNAVIPPSTGSLPRPAP